MKNTLIFKLVLSLGMGLFVLGLIFPYTSKADSVQVNPPEQNWLYYQRFNKGGCGAGANGDFVAETIFNIQMQKQFYMYSSGLGNLNQYEARVIRPGESIAPYNSPVTGQYTYYSGDHGTPDMDNNIYDWNYGSGTGACGAQYDVINKMRGGFYGQLGYQLTSSDNSVVDCSNGQSCIAKDKNGTVQITASFSGGGASYIERAFQFGHYMPFITAAIATTKQTGYGRFASYTTTYSCNPGSQLRQYINYSRGAAVSSYLCIGPTIFRSEGGGYTAQQFNYTLSPITYNLTVQKPNEAPLVSNVIVDKIGKRYTEASVKWNYSDKEGDPQVVSQIQIVTAAGAEVYTGYTTSATEISLLGESNITGLQPGITYYARVRATDINHLLNNQPWVYSGSFNMINYPIPIVDYKINNSSNSPVTVKTGENVNAVWNITDADGLVPNSCSISSVGFDDINGTGLSLNSSRSAVAPTSLTDQTYRVNLSCAAKPGGTAVNQDITVKVESYPVISCSIKKNVVSIESPKADIEGEIKNAAAPYTWQIKRYAGESYGSPITSSSTKQSFSLDYTGIGLGKYTPVIQVKGVGGRTVEKECSGGISNLGNRSIKEVAK